MDENVVMLQAQCVQQCKLRYKHASFGNMLWVECGFYFTSDENFLNHGATYGFGREERWIC